MVTLANHRNAAAADGDHHVAVIHQRFYRLFLDNIYRHGRRDDATVAAPGVLFHDVAVLAQLFGLFFAEERADGLGRIKKCLIVSVHFHLGYQGRHRDIQLAR